MVVCFSVVLLTGDLRSRADALAIEGVVNLHVNLHLNKRVIVSYNVPELEIGS